MPPPSHEHLVPKGVTCGTCQKRFSRTDHLKRHQLRHSGVKPYACIFCSEGFTRSDNLRDHYQLCLQRKNRQIPEAGRGGRRCHACDTCTSMKLGCDGKRPCQTCRAKRIECKFSRLQSRDAFPAGVDRDPKAEKKHDPGYNRGSIMFLLNSGTASFMEAFRFPSSSAERRTAARCNIIQDDSIQPTASMSSPLCSNGSETGSPLLDQFAEEPMYCSLFEDENLVKFLRTPFDNPPGKMDLDLDPHGFVAANFMPLGTVTSIQVPPQWETVSDQTTAIANAILTQATILNLGQQERAQISQHLFYFFTPTKIRRLVDVYFKTWQQICPILHQPTFNIETVPIALLISVTLMGALYSHVDREVSTARLLLDLAEMYVFSLDELSDDFEIREMLQTSSRTRAPHTQKCVAHLPVFENVQAAYINLCSQTWSGSAVSKQRSIQTRFHKMVKVARQLGLMKARHDEEDSMDENLWIQKEMRIRLINIMALIDCAFVFFVNYPARLLVVELNCDLPSEERFWTSPNPFSIPFFEASRNMTTLQAFRTLFTGENPPSEELGKQNPLGFNHIDMFIMIHLLYVYTHTHLILYSPCSLSPNADPSITPIREALTQWRIIFTSIRASMPTAEWDRIGFLGNGNNYWLVTQLLINTKGSAEVLRGMGVGCTDALKHIRGLLKDGGDGDESGRGGSRS